MFPVRILEDEGIADFLAKRQLTAQFAKAKRMILSGNNSGALLRKREPAELGMWYFRINKKYRAIGPINQDGAMIVTEIDDHQ